jgi:hypothetical protein
MTRPRVSDFVCGHRATVAASSTIAVLMTLSWFAPHGVSWFSTLVALLFCKACFAAKRRIAIWTQWNLAWNQMAEPTAHTAPPSRAAPRASSEKPSSAVVEAVERKPRRIPRAALIATWLVLFAWLKSHQGESSTPSLGIGALCFFGLALWGAFAATRKAGRWLLSPAHARARSKAPDGSDALDNATDADGNAIVAQCLPVPTAVPSGHVRDVLPAYCRELLERKPREAAGSTT